VLDNEAVLVLLRELSRSANDLVDKPGHIHRLEIEVELAGLRIFERSSISLMRLRRWVPAVFTRRSGSRAFSVPNRAALVTIISLAR
jgi:hypothetical protein